MTGGGRIKDNADGDIVGNSQGVNADHHNNVDLG